ncbi:hypothetical protein SS50377_24760 [Spironucleus salmonicida]|uniref:Uncharacterized protein n=1 Tax=Spironucleus salmonicida TaxID=348837 RepID=A0A9P8LR22_9EUKA|nr:hypothetical protein SS50377_24760 [Spironucleus salmonicida]
MRSKLKFGSSLGLALQSIQPFSAHQSARVLTETQKLQNVQVESIQTEQLLIPTFNDSYSISSQLFLDEDKLQICRIYQFKDKVKDVNKELRKNLKKLQYITSIYKKEQIQLNKMLIESMQILKK